MKGLAIYMFAVFCGFSVLTVAVGHYENSQSAQKIKNIETMINLKRTLETELSIKETKLHLKETKRILDSIDNSDYKNKK